MCLGNSMAPKNIFNSILCLVPYTDNPLCILFYALQCAAWHDPRSCACRHLPVFSRLRSHPRWILDRVWLPRGQQHIGRKSAKEKSRRASELRAIAWRCHQIITLPGSQELLHHEDKGHTLDTATQQDNEKPMETWWKPFNPASFLNPNSLVLGFFFLWNGPWPHDLAQSRGGGSGGDDSRSGNSTSKRNSDSKTRIGGSSRQQQQQQPQPQQEQQQQQQEQQQQQQEQ